MAHVTYLLIYGAAYIIFLLHPEYLTNYKQFLSVQTVLFALYGVFAYHLLRSKTLPLKTLAVVLMFIFVIFLPREFFLSKDAYRYVWDGMILVNGQNPYLSVPEDSANKQYWEIPNYIDPTSELVKVNDLYKRLDWKGLYSPYPPVAQIIFAGAYLMYLLFGIVGVKLVFTLPIFVLAYLLYKDRYPKLAILLLVNPLVVSEVYYSAHIDAYALPLMYLAVNYIAKKDSFKASLATAIGFLTKLYPAMIMPFLGIHLLKNKQYKKVIVSMFVFSAISVFAWAPFLNSSMDPLIHYVELPDEQEYNASVYRWSYQWITLYAPDLKAPDYLKTDSQTHSITDAKIFAKYISLSLLMLGTLILLFTKYSTNTILIAGILYLFVSPVVFPWYTLFLIPLVFTNIKDKRNYKLIIPLIIGQAIMAWSYFEPKDKAVRDMLLNYEYIAYIILIGIYIYLLKKGSQNQKA
jgi:alpha-1,6-mannosyltransferase